jgi:hypothetical protein
MSYIICPRCSLLMNKPDGSNDIIYELCAECVQYETEDLGEADRGEETQTIYSP